MTEGEELLPLLVAVFFMLCVSLDCTTIKSFSHFTSLADFKGHLAKIRTASVKIELRDSPTIQNLEVVVEAKQ